MNKAYRTIWSMAKQCWTVAAENVKGGGGPLGGLVLQLAVCGLLAGGTVSAQPVNPQVVAGTASFATNGSTLAITNSANAIINWQNFSIAANETTRFIQPSALSAVLNRVTGGDPSAIYGALQSNGKVFLINQNGILFGPGARVDVNGLVASTLNLSNEDFLAGRMHFAAGPRAGSVENQGAITTPHGGQVYLIASEVHNSGIITAPNGDILLAAGKEVLLVDQNSPEIAVVVTAPEGQALNLGTLAAEAGRIGLYGSIIRQSGMISANSAVQDAQGRIFLRSTGQTTLAPTSIIKADGSGTTGGGKVVVWSDGATVADGRISARAGSDGGDGGFIETSGSLIDFSGLRIDTSAPKGNNGLWLIDPTDLVIDATGAAALTSALDGSNVSIMTTTCDPTFGSCTVGNGDITLAAQLGGFVNAGGNTLTLTAERNITIDAPIVAGSSGLGGLILNAAQDISINQLVATNSSIQATATAGGIFFGSLDAGTTNGQFNTTFVDLTAGGAIYAGIYGFAPPDVVSQGLSMTTGSGIAGLGGSSPMKVEVGGGVSFASSGGQVYLHNSSPASTRMISGTSGGSIRLESSDSSMPTQIGPLTATGGDIILRMNNLSVTDSVNAGAGRVYVAPFTISPSVLNMSIEGAFSPGTVNLTSTSLNNLNGSSIVIGADSFGNYTPQLTIGTDAAVSLSGPKQFEFWGETITTGSNPFTLSGVGAGLKLVGTLSGGQISLGSGLIDVTSGTVKIGAASSATDIYLGGVASPGLNIPSLGTISAQNVNIGDPGPASGAITVVNAVSTSSSSPHILNAGSSGLSQLAGATLGIPALGITAYGDVLLPEANTSATLAATTTGNLRFSAVGDLNLGLLGGLSGVTSGGQISLAAGGTLTQSAGALLTSTSLRVSGLSVVLNEANPVGVIAGGATGVGANDRFEYTSVNMVTLSDVDGVSGVTAAAGGANPLGVRLTSTGSGINQAPTAPLLSPGRRVELISANDVVLDASGNDFGGVIASAPSASLVSLRSAGPLAIPYLGAGIATIDVGSSGGVLLSAPSLTLDGEIHGAGVQLLTDSIGIAATATVAAADPAAGVTIATMSDNRPITIGSACTGGIPCLLLSDVSEARFSGGGGLAIGEADPLAANTAGTITISGAVSRPSSGLALLSGASVTQTAPIAALGVAVEAGGAVTLADPANSFSGVAVQSGGGGVSVVSSQPLSVGLISSPSFTINGITSSNSAVTLSSSGGSIDLQAPLNAGTAPVTLSSTGPLSASAGFIVGSQLTATATGGISLDGNLPQVALTNNGSGDIWYGSGTSLLASVLNAASGGMVNLSVPSGDLTVTSAASSNGDLGLTAGSGLLTLNGNLTAGTGLVFLEGGSVNQVAGTISGQSVNLRALTAGSGTLTLAGAIDATQSIDLETDNLVLSSPALTVPNTSIQNEIGIRPTSAGRSITIGGTGSGLTIATINSSVFNAPTLVIGDDGADMYAVAAGPITVASAISWPQRLAMVTGSTVSQSPGATIAANELGVIAGGSVTLAEPGNAVANFVAELTTGDLSFSSTLPLSVVEVVGGVENPRTITGVSTGNGFVALATTGGNLTLDAPVNAGSGAVSLDASGSILDTFGLGVIGSTLSASAGGDIGSATASLFSEVSQWTTLSAGGSIYAENYGAVSTGSAAVTASSGVVTLKAHSPLTIGSGGVSAQSDIYLEAVASGAGDDLTINGPISSTTGTITLKAANYVVEGVGSSTSTPDVTTIIDQTGTTVISGSGEVTPLPTDQLIDLPPDLEPLPPEAPLYSDPAASGQTMVLASVTTSTEPTTEASTDTTDTATESVAEQQVEGDGDETEEDKQENEQAAAGNQQKEEKSDAKRKKLPYCN